MSVDIHVVSSALSPLFALLNTTHRPLSYVINCSVYVILGNVGAAAVDVDVDVDVAVAGGATIGGASRHTPIA